MTRAAIYVRLSEADERSTFARQQTDCTTKVDARGWIHDPDADVYSDYGVSAWRQGVIRPAFERLLDQLDRYDVLVAWKLDRVVRSHRDLSRLLDRLDRHQVALVLVTEGLDASTPMGRAMLELGTTFANLEATTTGLRVRSAQQHMTQAGRHRGSPIPYGWTPGPHPDGPGTWLHLDPDEAPVVREMVDRLLAGTSARSIAHDLNDRAVRTRKGSRWTSATVLGIVRSPRMVGWQPYSDKHRSGQVARDDDGNPVAAGEPMVDEITWRRVLGLGRGAAHTARFDGSWLNGLAVCAICGSRMHANGTNYHASYLCSARRSAGATVHGPVVSMRRVKLEGLVETVVEAREHDLPRPATPPDGHLAELTTERDRLRARIDTLDDDWTAGHLDDRRHRRLTATLAGQLDDVEARLTAAGAAQVLSPPVDLERWRELPSDRRRAFLASLVTKIEVQPYRLPDRTADWRVRIEWIDGHEVTV